jgi:hypothetical protein
MFRRKVYEVSFMLRKVRDNWHRTRTGSSPPPSLSLCLIFKQIIGSPSVILVVLEARVVLVLALKWFKVLIYIFIFMLLWNDRKIYIEIFTLQSTHLTLIKLWKDESYVIVEIPSNSKQKWCDFMFLGFLHRWVLASFLLS